MLVFSSRKSELGSSGVKSITACPKIIGRNSSAKFREKLWCSQREITLAREWKPEDVARLIVSR